MSETKTYLLLQPQAPCPKCGTEVAFTDYDPRFMVVGGVEYLEWTCLTCRYTVVTQTVDGKWPNA